MRFATYKRQLFRIIPYISWCKFWMELDHFGEETQHQGEFSIFWLKRCISFRINNPPDYLPSYFSCGRYAGKFELKTIWPSRQRLDSFFGDG